MMFKASDDFRQRSLGVLPTLLERLAYICSLQTDDGSYRHWGLSRTYGRRHAHEAIFDAHLEMATELVHTPLREIYQEFKEAVERPEGPGVLKAETFVLKAPVNDDALLAAHLRLLQDSVAALAHQGHTTQPGA
jgi:hypothetical protein